MRAGETRPANMTALRRLLDWRRVLVYTHRWLGICGGMLFVAWFVSGIVMMYAGMPSLSPAERLKRLPPLDLSSARFSPDEAAQSVGVTPGRVIVTMLGERPVYRMQTRGGLATVFADDGRRLDGLTGDDVMSVVADFAPEHVATLEYVRELSEPDQWTLQSRQFMPLHQVSLGDEADTQIYVSDRTGEPVMKTTRGGRRVAYVGAVLHWLYFTPFRRHSNLWLQTVIWLSIIGCVLCLTGLVWGVWRVSVSSRYRLRGAASHTPYAGLMRWHHYAGLIFGLTTFTWTLSGGLSLDPWNWHPPTSPTAAQRTAVAGGPFTLEGITLESLRTAVEVVATSFSPKELEVLRFRAESFLVARRATSGPGGIEHKLVSATRPAEGSFTVFDADDVFAAALAAMPGVDVEDSTWLADYDAYYYDRRGTRPLPVLRVRFDDPQQTWLYLDPGRGAIVLKEESLTRLNRWLYHGLHSLDFPFLYAKRPLWDIVVILLSVGGIVLSVTTVNQSWRRLRRHARRFDRAGLTS